METKKENYMNQSLRKVLSHQEKEQNLLQQEAAFLCSCPAQSLLKASKPSQDSTCSAWLEISPSSLFCAHHCAPSSGKALTTFHCYLASAAEDDWTVISNGRWIQDCEGPPGPSGLGVPTAEPHLLKVSFTDRTTSPEIQLILQLPIFLLGSCSQPHHSGC